MSNYSAPPTTTVETIAKCSTQVDYVQFKKWKTTNCFSQKEQFQVSASYAMGVIFSHTDGGYKRKKPLDIVPSFFRTDDGVRLGCYSYGHGIVYEGCWVTYDDKVMCGSSTRKLQAGKSFTVLCKSETFREWYTKVLNGVYEEYDFDNLTDDILTSLTSPDTPGSLASDNLAGSRPSAGLSTPDNQVAAFARQGRPSLRVRLEFGPPKKAAAPIQESADASTSLALTNTPASLTLGEKAKTAKLRADAGLSISNNDLAVADRVVTPSKSVSSLSHSSNKSIATVKEGKSTPAQDGSQPAGHAACETIDCHTTIGQTHHKHEEKESFAIDEFFR